MARNQLFTIFAVCSCVLGHAILSSAQGFPTAADETAKDMLTFPLSSITTCLYDKDFSYIKFDAKNEVYVTRHLNLTKKTLIHCHGYMQSIDNPYVLNLLRGYVSGYDYNIIAIDYRYVTYNFYATSVLLADAVSGVVKTFVENLVKGGVKAEDLILSGFSLGAQIMGNVARNVKFDIHNLIALDPAGPMYNYFETSVSASDALCVKCLHSDGGNYGIADKCGHLDFYPNGGRRNQPGCTYLLNLGACSHEKAEEISVEASQNHSAFPAIKCDSWFDFKNGNCNKSAVIHFEVDTPCNAPGKYYFQTNPEKPIARGMDGITYDSSLDDNSFG